MKKNLLLMLAIIIMIAMAATSYSRTNETSKKTKLVNGVIKNSSSRALTLDCRLYSENFKKSQDKYVLSPGGIKSLRIFEAGVGKVLPFYYNNDGDTLLIEVTVRNEGDIIEIYDSYLNSPLALVRTTLPDAPAAISPKPTPKMEYSVGVKVVNDLPWKIFLPNKKLCLSAGATSRGLVNWTPGQNNEPIIIETNGRLTFTEIRFYVDAKNRKQLVIDENMLLQGQSGDSLRLTLKADKMAYVFIDDKTSEIEVIKPIKGRGGYSYSRYFSEGVNTLLLKILEDGIEKIRYFTFVAAPGDNYVTPEALTNPPLFCGEGKHLPLVGFDRSCLFSLADTNSGAKKAAIKEVVGENDTLFNPNGNFFLGMNRILIKFFEETPQGRIDHSVEFYKLVAEDDSFFVIEPKYFWFLEGAPVPVTPKNVTADGKFSKMEFWALEKNLEPQKISLKKNYPADKIYAKVGVLKTVAYYPDGLFKKSATIKVLISKGDKNKEVEIREENIDRTK
ncbi:MAG: hypothetical protein WC458_03230 [Patescibacteria group bacterium]